MRKWFGLNAAIFFVPLFIMTAAHGQWNRSLVGSAPNFLYQVRIGDGRNDGVQRVYAVCWNAHVYEWTYTSGSWNRVDLGPMPGSNFSIVIDIGKGRNDGLNRIYTTRGDGHVYEYFYTGSSWNVTDLGNPNAVLYGVTVGPGRNDGQNRIYACGHPTPPVEYTWTGSAWSKDTVQPGNQSQWLPKVGPGRGDGVDRLYLPNGTGGTRTVAEYTWNGGGFTRADLPVVAANPLAVSIGRARNDGVDRVYSSTRSRVYEFAYQGGNWQTADILPALADEERYDLCLGRTKADGLFRVYITCSGTQFVEASWNGSAWIDTIIDTQSGATCGVAIGRGRNDDTTRVYGCGRNNLVYEFTHNDPYTGVDETAGPEIPSGKRAVAVESRPNPFRSHAELVYSLDRAGKVRLCLYAISGRKIVTLVDGFQHPGKYRRTWSGLDDLGREAPDGIYIWRLETAGGSCRGAIALCR